nr:zinc-binding dehydrogenase [Streptomyces paludis]
MTALARDRHAETLTALGADRVLDYGSTTSDGIDPFDVIVDTVGTELHCYRSRLAKGGRLVTVGLSAPALAAITTSTVYGPRRIRAFSANPDTTTLRDLATHSPGHVCAGSCSGKRACCACTWTARTTSPA